jgi:hypothetical protein
LYQCCREDSFNGAEHQDVSTLAWKEKLYVKITHHTGKFVAIADDKMQYFRLFLNVF